MEESSSQVVAHEYADIASLSGNGGYVFGFYEEPHLQASGSLPVWVNLLYFTVFILGSSLVCYLGWDQF